MRLLIAVVVIIYLIGIGVSLSPTIRAKWNTATASDLTARVMLELPHALTWPARVYRSFAGEPPTSPSSDQPKQ
jgi:hypothetical protein